jgi:hypothetical protein
MVIFADSLSGESDSSCCASARPLIAVPNTLDMATLIKDEET